VSSFWYSGTSVRLGTAIWQAAKVQHHVWPNSKVTLWVAVALPSCVQLLVRMHALAAEHSYLASKQHKYSSTKHKVSLRVAVALPS
jgi:beta-galactosidase/beta-glucuronidase